MPQLRRAVIVYATVVVALTSSPKAASALTIVPNFIGGQPLGPTFGGGNINDIFAAAAGVWESAIQDDFTITLDYGWGDTPGGTHTLLAQGGTPNRETHGLVLVQPQIFNDGTYTTLFMDPTPTLHEEFPIASESQLNLGGGLVNAHRSFAAPINGPDSLYLDLFTIVIHEIGHSLGLSNANLNFIAEGIDGNITVTSTAYAGTIIPLAFNNSGVTSHLNVDGVLMGGLHFNERTLPSALDILADAQLSGFTHLNLDLLPIEPPAPDPLPTPEPGTLVLLTLGGSGLLATRRR